MSLLINIAAQFSGKKALKEAQKQVNVLEKRLQPLETKLADPKLRVVDTGKMFL